MTVINESGLYSLILSSKPTGDEIIIEKKFNRFGLHFAVRPQMLPNRCKVTVIEKR